MDASEKSAHKRPSLPPDVREKLGRFPDRVKTLLESASLREIERITGVSQGALRNYKDGHSLPDLDRLIALALGAGVNLLWLATGDGPMKPRAPEVNEKPAPYSPQQPILDLGRLTEALEIVEAEAPQKSAAWRARMAVALYDLGEQTARDKKAALVRAAL